MVERLVRANRVSALISHSQKQQTTLWLCKRYLSNNLVEGLLEQVFTDGADALVTSLALEETGIERFAESGHIDTGSLFVRHVLNEVLLFLEPFARRQDCVHDVTSVGFAL